MPSQLLSGGRCCPGPITDVQLTDHAKSIVSSQAYTTVKHPFRSEYAMFKTTVLFGQPLYRWSLVLLPVLAFLLSACGTGGSSGGYGY
jgi:hypothetical protein